MQHASALAPFSDLELTAVPLFIELMSLFRKDIPENKGSELYNFYLQFDGFSIRIFADSLLLFGLFLSETTIGSSVFLQDFMPES